MKKYVVKLTIVPSTDNRWLNKSEVCYYGKNNTHFKEDKLIERAKKYGYASRENAEKNTHYFYKEAFLGMFEDMFEEIMEIIEVEV